MLRHVVIVASALAIFECGRGKVGPILDIDYLHEAPKDTAALFLPGIVSTDSFEHSAPAFSPDAKTVLWSVVTMPSWNSRILEMNYENGEWSTPHRPTFSDTAASDIYPSFSHDGRIVYFSSSRNFPWGGAPSKGNVLWTVERLESGWGVAQPLDTAVSKGGEYAISAAKNGNLYFTYGPFRSPDWNILIAKNASNDYSRPEKISELINTPGYEDGPFIAPDESYLIFESDRPGGVDGSIDLYISFRSPEGTWKEPVNMGPKINTGAAERFGRVSPDGKYFFFGRNRIEQNDRPGFDIYWIDAAVIAEVKAQTP